MLSAAVRSVLLYRSLVESIEEVAEARFGKVYSRQRLRLANGALPSGAVGSS